MKIRNIAHRGLRRLYEDDNARGVPAASADKLRDMLAAIEAMSGPAWAGLMESASTNRQSQGRMELERHPELAAHILGR